MASAVRTYGILPVCLEASKRKPERGTQSHHPRHICVAPQSESCYLLRVCLSNFFLFKRKIFKLFGLSECRSLFLLPRLSTVKPAASRPRVSVLHCRPTAYNRASFDIFWKISQKEKRKERIQGVSVDMGSIIPPITRLPLSNSATTRLLDESSSFTSLTFFFLVFFKKRGNIKQR